MRYLVLGEVIELHRLIIQQTGGAEEMASPVGEMEKIILQVASGNLPLKRLSAWIAGHVSKFKL
jgi:hypothetical protein